MLLVMSCVVVGVGGWCRWKAWETWEAGFLYLRCGLPRRFVIVLEEEGTGTRASAVVAGASSARCFARRSAIRSGRISRLWLLSMLRDSNKVILNGARNACGSDSFSTNDHQDRST